MSTSGRLRVVAWLALGAVGCDGAPPVPRAARPEDRPTERLVTRETVSREEIVASWDLTDPSEAARWKTSQLIADPKPEAGFRVDGTDPWLQREVPALAAFDLVRVEIERSAADAVKIFWAELGEPFSEERSVAALPEPDEQGRLHATLIAPRRVAWSARGGQLRLDPTAFPRKGHVRVLRVDLARLAVDRDRLDELIDEIVKIDVDGQVRYSRLVGPARATVWRRAVPEGEATLRFGLTSLDAAGRRAGRERLNVTVETAGKTVAGRLLGPRRTFAVTPKAGRWDEESFDLRPFAGRDVRIACSWSDVDPTDEPRVAAVANLEIVSGNERAAEGRPDLLLFVADTLRADRTSPYGNAASVTPRLEGWWRRRAARFATTVAAAPWTLPSHVSIFTGIDPIHHGVNQDRSRAPAGLTTLAEHLRELGYETVALTGGGFLAPSYGLHQGFERYFWWRDLSADSAQLPGHVEVARRILAEPRDRPLFLFFHTYETHTPHRFQEPHCLGGEDRSGAIDASPRPDVLPGYIVQGRYSWFDAQRRETGALTPADSDALLRLYDCGVARADRGFGQLLDALAELDLENSTVVAFTSDHGESLGENGMYLHGNLSRETLLVPWLVAPAASRSGGLTFATPAGGTDLAPTLLDLLGAAPLPDATGRSLAALWRGGEPTAIDLWSYAATTNHGLSRWRVDGIQELVRNGPWSPVAGQTLLYDRRRAERAAPRIVSPDEPASHAAEALRRYDRSAPGLELRFAAGGTPLEVAVSVTSRLVARLKLLDLGCLDCARLIGESTVELRVPPERQVRLLLEAAEAEGLTLEVRSPGRTDLALDSSELDAGVALTFAEGAWRRGPTAATPSIVFSRRSARFGAESATPSAEIDAGLRALGYLN